MNSASAVRVLTPLQLQGVEMVSAERRATSGLGAGTLVTKQIARLQKDWQNNLFIARCRFSSGDHIDCVAEKIVGTGVANGSGGMVRTSDLDHIDCVAEKIVGTGVA